VTFAGTLGDGDAERAVSASVRGGVLRGTVDGRPLPEAAVERRGAEVLLEAGGVRTRAVVAREGDRLLVHLDGRVHEFEVGDGVRRRPSPRGGRRARASDEPRALSPMTGTVVQVAVKPGESVAAGATLAVVEAMKMQFVVRAPRAVVVRSVSVAAGAAVEIGAVLVEFEDGNPSPDAPTRENAPR